MKNLIFVFLLSFQCFAQEIIQPAKSIVSVDRMNVVYRGIINPISISVPEAKSFKATGLGLKETDVKGKYNLSPGAGNEMKITIEAVMPNDSIVVEEKIFRIKGVGSLKAYVDGKNCFGCILEFSKKDLETAKIELKIDDFLHDVKFTLESFTVNLPNKRPIIVTGNQLNEIALHEIEKLKIGSIFTLENFRQSNPNNYCLVGIKSLKIMIVEETKIQE
ncbi:GldM family protein [Flavobacterium qiangtangense]|uniref:GldM family protein n=1 Tax=Flavobacterium qiangtangense TaxID=1442595 RepID=A0ABW1PSB7_9FLAO